MRRLRLGANWLFKPVSRQALNWRRMIETQETCENCRRQECDGEERPNDQDATALGRCEEFAGSPPKIVPPMRSMATDRVDVFGPTRDVAK